eukprot:jgi/Botrbrau1/19952/Bobra.0059s0068.1
MPGPKIPLLPGYTVREVPDVNKTLVQDAPDPTNLASPAGTDGAKESACLSKLPKWVVHDRQTLRWFGYYTEDVPQSQIETFRVRRLTILFYPEDDTLQVTEPKQDNSGLPQGVHLRRHKALKSDGAPVNPRDILVGGCLTLYGQEIIVVDADAFTRSYMADKYNIRLPDAKPYPQGHMELRAQARAAQAAGPKPPKLGHPETARTSRSFAARSSGVLRFYCVWDDRKSLYGDRRPYRLHYFLEDDTVEILEVHENNSGRDPFPMLLKRGRLPKSIHASSWCNDCDDFTRCWMKQNFGTTEAELEALNIREPIPEVPKAPLPPYNGFGSLEDSAQSCTSLVPRPPRKDLYKLMNKDPRRAALQVQFCRNILSGFDRSRQVTVIRTVIFYGRRHSGNFRAAIAKHRHRGGEVFGAAKDEYTYQYMENNRHLYVPADWELALRATRAQLNGTPDFEDTLRQNVVEIDSNGTGELTLAQFEMLLRRLGVELTRHQIISIYRRLAGDGRSSLPVEAALHAFLA